MSNLETKLPLPGHYSRTSPCYVKIKDRVLLTNPESSKRTYHISLDLSDNNLQFLPGDSLGILPENDFGLVDRLFNLLSSAPDQIIQDPRSTEKLSARDFLLKKVNLSRISSSLIKHLIPSILDVSTKEFLEHLLNPEQKTDLTKFIQENDLIDLLQLVKEKPSLEELVPFLAPLLPRFYSISSSLSAYPKEVHLLVALSSYLHRQELRFGVASHFLCHLSEKMHTPIPLYVQPATHFRLPNDDVDLIMIGPGTGVAPYRAFLQERIYRKSTGRHWLFFGERNKKNDFLYEDYFTALVDQNLLKLTLAFSRDQEEKIYVQHQLLANSKEVWQWLQKGAYFYVCGDATRMAKDVEHALLHIIQEEGNLSEADSKIYFKGLKTAKRYQTDVY